MCRQNQKEFPSHYDAIIIQFTVCGAGQSPIENISVVDMEQPVPVMICLIAFRLELQQLKLKHCIRTSFESKTEKSSLRPDNGYIYFFLNNVKISAM